MYDWKRSSIVVIPGMLAGDSDMGGSASDCCAAATASPPSVAHTASATLSVPKRRVSRVRLLVPICPRAYARRPLMMPRKAAHFNDQG